MPTDVVLPEKIVVAGRYRHAPVYVAQATFRDRLYQGPLRSQEPSSKAFVRCLFAMSRGSVPFQRIPTSTDGREGALDSDRVAEF